MKVLASSHLRDSLGGGAPPGTCRQKKAVSRVTPRGDVIGATDIPFRPGSRSSPATTAATALPSPCGCPTWLRLCTQLCHVNKRLGSKLGGGILQGDDAGNSAGRATFHRKCSGCGTHHIAEQRGRRRKGAGLGSRLGAT